MFRSTFVVDALRISKALYTPADNQKPKLMTSAYSQRFLYSSAANKGDAALRPLFVSLSPFRFPFSFPGPSCDGKLRLATDLLDIPAELIAEAYRLRWLIELFFRMFKQLLGCRHLLSTKQNGVEIQTYIAIIACLLILIHTGRAPTKRTYEMICLYMSGWASLDELERHIEKLKAAKK